MMLTFMRFFFFFYWQFFSRDSDAEKNFDVHFSCLRFSLYLVSSLATLTRLRGILLISTKSPWQNLLA